MFIGSQSFGFFVSVIVLFYDCAFLPVSSRPRSFYDSGLVKALGSNLALNF